MNCIRIMELRGTYKGGGGPDKTILLSAARHNENKFFVLVTYLRDPSDSEFQIGKMAKHYGVKDYIEVFDRSMLDLRCLFELNNLVKKNHIQIIHVHDLKTTLLGILLKVLNPKVRIMSTAHGWIINSRMDRLKQKLQFLMLRYYPLHIAVSEATKKLMIDNGIDSESIKVLYNSIDIDHWKRNGAVSTVKEEFNILDENMIVGTVGRLSREKDLPTFFKVACNILKHYPDTKFLIVGDGKGVMLEELKTLSNEMGLRKSVIFTGHRNDLKNIYISFDIFLSTSLTEGLPNTVLEAMALEVPVVATKVGGLPELIEDTISGTLCRPSDVDAITDAVLNLINDYDQRCKFASNGRKKMIDRFSFDIRLETIETYYEYMVNNL